MNPLNWLGLGWVKLALIGAAVAALAAGYAWRVHIERDVGRAEVQLKWDADVSRQRAAMIVAVEAARTEEGRKTAAVQKEVEDARKELAALRGTYSGAVTAGQRLRAQLAAAYAACRGTSQPAVASGGPPAQPTADLFAELQRRLDDAENDTIRFADESSIAGRACERAYQALTPP